MFYTIFVNIVEDIRYRKPISVKFCGNETEVLSEIFEINEVEDSIYRECSDPEMYLEE